MHYQRAMLEKISELYIPQVGNVALPTQGLVYGPLPYFVAHAVCLAFYYTFPGSRPQIDDSFKDQVNNEELTRSKRFLQSHSWPYLRIKVTFLSSLVSTIIGVYRSSSFAAWHRNINRQLEKISTEVLPWAVLIPQPLFKLGPQYRFL